MAEALAYLPTLALFSFVIVASGRMKHDMLLLACFPPVFVAMVMGFTMAIYSDDAFGLLPTVAAAAVGIPPGWWLANRAPPACYPIWRLRRNRVSRPSDQKRPTR
jgi:hypothetical protein